MANKPAKKLGCNGRRGGDRKAVTTANQPEARDILLLETKQVPPVIVGLPDNLKFLNIEEIPAIVDGLVDKWRTQHCTGTLSLLFKMQGHQDPTYPTTWTSYLTAEPRDKGEGHCFVRHLLYHQETYKIKGGSRATA
jgi:hypothetical protein